MLVISNILDLQQACYKEKRRGGKKKSKANLLIRTDMLTICLVYTQRKHKQGTVNIT